MRIFISHSHSDTDTEIAEKLIEYLLSALRIEDEEQDIRCTSVPNYKLPPGTNIEKHLKEDLNNDITLIGLLTPHSLRSDWVLFELGAAWGMGKTIIPVLGPKLNIDNLPGPLKNYQHISIESEDVQYDLNSMINVLAQELKIERKFGNPQEHKRDKFIHHLKTMNYPENSEVKDLEIAHLREQNKQLQKKVKQLELSALGLRSEKGIDYTRLNRLLAQKIWQEADIETTNLMLEAIGKDDWEDVRGDDIDNFPGQDLQTIDQLWGKYSEGRFGFSVQEEIWQDIGGKVDEETAEKLGNRLDWRENGKWLNYDDLKNNREPPIGYFPFCGGVWIFDQSFKVTAVVRNLLPRFLSRLSSVNNQD